MDMRPDMSEGLRKAAALGADGTLAELGAAGLRERDYEDGPLVARLEVHRDSDGEGKRVVCECAGHEPGLEIDRSLLREHGSLVVEGALIAALATGSSRMQMHVAADDHDGAEAVARALETLPAGEPGIEVVGGPFRKDLRGYERVPTLVLSCETLLHVSRVARDGPESYRKTGTPESPGTKVFQVSGVIERPGCYELPLGVTLRSLLYDTAGGIRGSETLQAVIVGGTRGAWYTPDDLDLPLDFDGVRAAGGVIGAGGVAVLGDKDCVVDQVRRRLEHSCYDECGACSLGREGSYQLREIVADMTRGKSRSGDLDMLREVGRAMRLAAACSFGRTAPNIVLSTLQRLPDECEAHMKRKRCKALVCAQYVTFHILPDLCDGCGACVDECPEDAIEGGRNKIHVIDQDACEKCGVCHEVCSGLRKAVVKAGPVKPQTPKRPIPVGTWKQ